MCVVCTIGGPEARGVAGGQRPTAIWGNMKESWLTYADYSQHCPQVIIKCLPGVIYICDYTDYTTFSEDGARFRAGQAGQAPLSPGAVQRLIQ